MGNTRVRTRNTGEDMENTGVRAWGIHGCGHGD